MPVADAGRPGAPSSAPSQPRVPDRRQPARCWPATPPPCSSSPPASAFVIMLGGIDLSIQAMASLASVIVALTIGRARLRLLRRWRVARRRASPASLGGLAHVKLQDPVLHRHARRRRRAGRHRAGHLAASARSRSDEAQRAYLAWVTGTTFGIPHEIFIGAVVLVVAHIVQSRTRFGRYSAAIGAGEAAAYASGVKVDRQKVIAFVAVGRLRRPSPASSWPAASPAARRRSPTSCCCPRSPPSSSAARRSPAASAASGARWSAR